jgi:hypothetical protein
MRESTTYQAILREGRIEGRLSGARRMLLIQGEIRFGTPDERIREAVEMIRDLERLERMCLRILNTNIHDWEGLLGTP